MHLLCVWVTNDSSLSGSRDHYTCLSVLSDTKENCNFPLEWRRIRIRLRKHVDLSDTVYLAHSRQRCNRTCWLHLYGGHTKEQFCTFLQNVGHYLYFKLYGVTCQNSVALILITARMSFLSPTEMLILIRCRLTNSLPPSLYFRNLQIVCCFPAQPRTFKCHFSVAS
jgi:hypothetical protein